MSDADDARAEMRGWDATAPGEPLETWAVVEAMGYRQMIGRVTETAIAGQPMIRVDRLDGITQYVAPSSLYMLTPVPEDVARKAHAREALGAGLPRAITSGISFDGKEYVRGLPSGDPVSPWRADPWGDEADAIAREALEGGQ